MGAKRGHCEQGERPFLFVLLGLLIVLELVSWGRLWDHLISQIVCVFESDVGLRIAVGKKGKLDPASLKIRGVGKSLVWLA